MNETFLQNLMIAAKKISHAERAMVVNADLQVVSMENLDQETIESEDFNEFASTTLAEAVDKNEALITNNVVTDPSDAPITNTNFSNLRVVVAIPVEGHGAIYLDQHIRNGIIPKPMIDRFEKLVKQLLTDHQEDTEASDMVKMFQKIR